jgi:hypothetical protein
MLDQIPYDSITKKHALISTIIQSKLLARVCNTDATNDARRYRVYRNGVVAEERDSVSDLWAPYAATSSDAGDVGSGNDGGRSGGVSHGSAGGMVGFLLGCSFSWEQALVDAGLIPRHIEEGRNVPMCVRLRAAAGARAQRAARTPFERKKRRRDLER